MNKVNNLNPIDILKYIIRHDKNGSDIIYIELDDLQLIEEG